MASITLRAKPPAGPGGPTAMSRTPRTPLGWLACVAALALSPAPARAQERPAGAPERPNVILLLIDDLGRNDLGCYGSTFYETPNLDRLAARGARFAQAYAACPVCSP